MSQHCFDQTLGGNSGPNFYQQVFYQQPIIMTLEQRRKKKRLGSSSSSFASSGDGGMIKIVLALIAGAGSAFLLAIILLASRLENVIDEGGTKRMTTNNNAVAVNDSRSLVRSSVEKKMDSSSVTANKPIKDRLFFPALPPHLMAEELYGSEIVSNLLEHNEPTIAGIIALIQRFLLKYHNLLIKHRDQLDAIVVLKDYFALLDEILGPFESAYRNKSIFPIREDKSIFISLASYRDHLLGETLRQAFKFAAYPDKLFIGAVVQNCFGLGDVTCRTGVEVKGKDNNGNWITKISDKPPDVNGIEEFCTDPKYLQYCNSGQIRVIYVNETESNGPTQARYFASKLWGGETFFMQADAHLRFVPEWDRLYHEEIMLAKSYPKAILSTYPPGFNVEDPPYKGGTVCPRLCECEFSGPDDGMIRINTGHDCRKEGEQHVPTQVAYIAAGFFFTRAEWLTDVPFDPYLPFIFMGEEIMLSLRSWTHGWDIYAPRKDYFAHQYRPGSMGLPKFWENLNRVFGGRNNGFDGELSIPVVERIKNIMQYNGSDTESIETKGYQFVLENKDQYGPGTERSLQQFYDHTAIDVKAQKCGWIEWCNECGLP